MQKDMTREAVVICFPNVGNVQCATREEQGEITNNSRKNEEAGPKKK